MLRRLYDLVVPDDALRIRAFLTLGDLWALCRDAPTPAERDGRPTGLRAFWVR